MGSSIAAYYYFFAWDFFDKERNSMKKKFMLLGLVAVLILALAGCGKKGGESAGDTADGVTAGEDGADDGDGTDTGDGADDGDGTDTEDGADTGDGADAGDADSADGSANVILGEYKGLEYTEQSLEVTEEDLQQAIEDFLAEHPLESQVKDRAVEDGDMVSIDFVGYVDGEAFDGGTGSKEDLVIGSGYMIPGFEEGIIGTMPGDTVSVDATFPEAYRAEGTAGSELNGAAAVFDITVHYITEQENPEYNEAFIQENTEYSTIEEFEAGLRSDLEEEKASSVEDAKLDEIFGQVMENSQILNVPDEKYQKYYDNVMQSYQSMADSAGVELDDFLQAYYGLSEDYLKQYADSYAQNMSKQAVIFDAIAEAEDITVSEEEYQAGVDRYFAEMGSSYESQEAFEEEMEAAIRESLLYEKVMEFVVGQSVAVPA